MWNKRICFFTISVDLITFWMFGESFVNSRLNIPLQVVNCRFGASSCVLRVVVDTGVLLSNRGEMPKAALQSLMSAGAFCCQSCCRCLRGLAGHAVKPKVLYFLAELFFHRKINLWCSICFLTRQCLVFLPTHHES